MTVRLQTWFPYHIQIALNGREWLRRRLEARGVDFLRQGNKFLHIEDYALAQRCLRQQLDRLAPYLHTRPQQGRRVRALDISGKDRINRTTPGHRRLIYPDAANPYPPRRDALLRSYGVQVWLRHAC